MEKTINAVKYMISVWDETSTWRNRPDHVQQKFLEAEKELKSIPNGSRFVIKIIHSENQLTNKN